MSNFRLERLFIRVSDVIDFDPNHGFDPYVFANVAELVEEFVRIPGYITPRWFSAKRGLETVKRLLDDDGLPHRGLSSEERETLEVVLGHLEKLWYERIKFYFIGRDVPAAKVPRERLPARQWSKPVVMPLPEEPRFDIQQLKVAVENHVVDRGSIEIVWKQGVDCQNLQRYMFLDEYAEFWARFFFVSLDHFCQWKRFYVDNQVV